MSSGEIVPRWEWRTFGVNVVDGENAIASRPPENVTESHELYVLSVFSSASVKVRAGLMDVKRLELVDADGLERWKPVLKAAFPLAASDTRLVMDALGVSLVVGDDEYSLDALLEELVEPSPDLLAAKVHKQRHHYRLAGCMAEVSRVETEWGARQTIAVESEDPARVTALVHELGFETRPNVSLPRALKALAGFGSRRYAVIDVGTNSVKFHIGELSADGEWATVVDRAEVTRLGEGLDATGALEEVSMDRTIDAVAAMVAEARRSGVEGIAAVGTAGLRLASNSAAFVAGVRERAGIDVEVISGEEEARLAYLAARAGLRLGDRPLAVFDTGGGRSQFTFGDGDRVDERFSVNVGAARFSERYGLQGAVTEETLAAALAAIADDLARLDGRPTPATLVGMGGALTNLAAVKHGLTAYDPEVVQGTALDLAEIDRQIELYRTRTVEQRREVVGLQPKRAEVILAGACIARTVLTKLGCDAITVSDRGLRHGLLVERFGNPRELPS